MRFGALILALVVTVALACPSAPETPTRAPSANPTVSIGRPPATEPWLPDALAADLAEGDPAALPRALGANPRQDGELRDAVFRLNLAIPGRTSHTLAAARLEAERIAEAVAWWQIPLPADQPLDYATAVPRVLGMLQALAAQGDPVEAARLAAFVLSRRDAWVIGIGSSDRAQPFLDRVATYRTLGGSGMASEEGASSHP